MRSLDGGLVAWVATKVNNLPEASAFTLLWLVLAAVALR